MLQRGTGERFKYKAEVKKLRPGATCSGQRVDAYMGRQHKTKMLYAVKVGVNRISDVFRSAEDAWADAYIKLTQH